jgi:hypothetical protein
VQKMVTQYPTEAQRIRLTARELAEKCFEEVERRFASGATLDVAKQEVLDDRIPGYLTEHGQEVADLVIQSVMTVTERSTHPDSRRKHRHRRWLHLIAMRKAEGTRPPTGFEAFLFRWFGREPR